MPKGILSGGQTGDLPMSFPIFVETDSFVMKKSYTWVVIVRSFSREQFLELECRLRREGKVGFKILDPRK